MALLFYDGFDHYGTTPSDILQLRGGGMQWSTMGGVTYASPGRGGNGSCIVFPQNARLLGTISSAMASGYFGTAFKITVSSASIDSSPRIYLMDLHSGDVSNPVCAQIFLELNVFTASVGVYRGDGTRSIVPNVGAPVLLGTSANNTLTMNAWNYLECFVTISATVGAVIVRNNGQELLNLSGINTLASSTHAYFEGIWLAGGAAPTAVVINFDDFYLADTTSGSGVFPFNFFAGDVRVITLYPVSNSGSPGWTPLSGSNWQNVDETHADGDTTYNSTTTVAAKDLFNFQSLSGTITSVLAVEVIGCYRKDDAGTRIVEQHLISGGTDTTGASYSLTSNYVYISDFYVVDPDTNNSWTVTAVNALQAGYKLVS